MRVLVLTIPVLIGFSGAGCGAGGGEVDAPICTPGVRACSDDGAAVTVCAEDGMAFTTAETCIQGATCGAGLCACPAGRVPGADACLDVGVSDCPAWAPLEGGLCTPTVPECGAGEGPALDTEAGCVTMGIETCPSDWERMADDTCAPLLPICDDDEIATFDGACTGLGPASECGAPPFGVLAPEGETVWVLDDAPPGAADGTEAHPFPTLAAALDAVPAGGTILVGSGVYDGGVVVDKPVHIRGRCPKEVTLRGPVTFTLDHWGAIPMEALIHVDGAAGVEISGFTLDDGETEEGQRAVGIVATDAPDLILADLRIVNSGGAGLDLSTCPGAAVSRVTVEGLTVRNGSNPFGQAGYGLRLTSSPATVTRCLFLDNEGADIYGEASCLDLSFSHFEGRGGVINIAPMGVWLEACEGDGHLIQHCRFFDKMTHGLLVRDSVVTVEDCRFEEGVTDYDDLNGPALRAEDSEVTIRRNWFRENQLASVAIVRSSGLFEGNRIEDTIGSDPSLNGGEGLLIFDCDPGPITVASNSVVSNFGSGMVVSSSFGIVRGNHVVDTMDPPTEQGRGAGINVVFGSDVAVEENRVESSRYAGIRFAGAFGSVHHNLVAGSLVSFDGFGGAGILLEKGAHLGGGVVGNFLVGNQAAGFLSSQSHFTELRNNLVTGTVASEQGCAWGAMIVGGSGAVASNRFTANEGGGVLVSGSIGPVLGNVVDANGSSKGPVAGIAIQDTDFGTVSLEKNTIIGNRFAGIAIRASKFEVVGNSISGQVEGNGGGMGIWVEGEGAGEIRRNLVRNNQVAGIGARDIPDLEVAGNLVTGTRKGTVGDSGDLAAGLAAFSGAFVSTLYNQFTDNRGPGLLFHDLAEGSVQFNSITENDGAAIQVSGSEVDILDNSYTENATDGIVEADATGPSGLLGPWPICEPPESGL
ncbi:MAG: right-handed parallel beta-helix repeat-containing protein [Pseudomonadota bacterium]